VKLVGAQEALAEAIAETSAQLASEHAVEVAAMLRTLDLDNNLPAQLTSEVAYAYHPIEVAK
jgi:hypothetical protein